MYAQVAADAVREAVMLRDLLARIHRDGGHYLAKVGVDRAVEEAHRLVSERTSLLEEVRQTFTRDDDLPDGLLTRIDKALDA